MFNCNGVFPISKCSGGDIKFNLRDNQKQYRLSSSHNLENKVSLTVINNGKEKSYKVLINHIDQFRKILMSLDLWTKLFNDEILG